MRIATALLTLLLFSTIAEVCGEVIDLEGTVKAVDAEARTISIERKTPKGTKTLELEVTKKAGDLGTVKAGDKISFSYDPDLEVVTKFSGGKGAETASQNVKCRVIFSISDTGDCKLRLERSGEEKGETGRERQENGTWVFTHFFSKAADVDFFESPFGPVLNVKVDPSKKSLVFTPASPPGSANKASAVTYPGRIRGPFVVEADLEASGNNFEFQINPMPTKLGQRQAIVSIKSGDAFKQEATVRVGSMTRDAQGKPAFDPPLIEDEKISLKDPWEESFRLPIPNVRNRDSYILRLGSLGDSAVVVSRLRVSGTPLPSIGLSLAEKDGLVYADKVMPKSLADKARFQVGDVIAAIVEKEPKSVNEAMDLLGDLPLDEASEITVKRGDEKRTFTVTPTFGK